MAIKKIKVEVTRVDEYEIEIDDSIYTDETIEQWSEDFTETDEDDRLLSFVSCLAKAITYKGKGTSLEGFGNVKQKWMRKPQGELLVQFNNTADGLQLVSEEEYSPGILVNIINYNSDLESEVFVNLKK